MKETKESNRKATGILYPVAWFLIAISALHFFNKLSPVSQKIPYSDFLRDLDQNKIHAVVLNDHTLTGTRNSDKPGEGLSNFVTVMFEDPELVQRLQSKGVVFSREISDSGFYNILIWVIPILISYLIWSFVLKGAAKGMQGGLLSVTKSKVKTYMEKDIKTTFADVAGVTEAKTELAEVVQFLKEPDHYARLGGHIPKGVLLIGPPGTGKTLLARAIAGEANVPFFSINGSEFVELFVGVGAARVRDLFEQASKSAPCILFIDEIDALGKSRVGNRVSFSNNDEKEQTLNQLLAEMDGFDPREGVILLAATNRPEILDPALLRAGRFDRQILVNLPDQAGRAEILKVHLKKIKIDDKMDSGRIAALTPGFSGADLATVVNEAALVATRRNANFVTEDDFTQAIERIVAGLEQRKKIMNPIEKRQTAYHEMGHAAVALALGTDEKIYKVSIIPRGVGALGYTLRRPTEDRYIQNEDDLRAKIAILLGGRASEKAFFGKTSTSAADDLVKANDIAKAMVTRFAMSEQLGLTVYDTDHSPFLRMESGSNSPTGSSEATAQLIDQEVRSILDKAYVLAANVIEKSRDFIQAGVEELLVVETLNEEKILTLWNSQIQHASSITPCGSSKNAQSDEKSGHSGNRKPSILNHESRDP